MLLLPTACCGAIAPSIASNVHCIRRRRPSTFLAIENYTSSFALRPNCRTGSFKFSEVMRIPSKSLLFGCFAVEPHPQPFSKMERGDRAEPEIDHPESELLDRLCALCAAKASLSAKRVRFDVAERWITTLEAPIARCCRHL